MSIRLLKRMPSHSTMSSSGPAFRACWNPAHLPYATNPSCARFLDSMLYRAAVGRAPSVSHPEVMCSPAFIGRSEILAWPNSKNGEPRLSTLLPFASWIKFRSSARIVNSLSRVAAAAQVGAYCGEDWICPMSFARSLRESLCPRLPATPEACDNSRRLEALAPPCSVRKSMRSKRVERIQTTHPRCGPLSRNTQGYARRIIRVDVLREPWQRTLQRQRLCRIDPLLHSTWSRTGSLEGGDGTYGRQQRDSRSWAGGS